MVLLRATPWVSVKEVLVVRWIVPPASSALRSGLDFTPASAEATAAVYEARASLKGEEAESEQEDEESGAVVPSGWESEEY